MIKLDDIEKELVEVEKYDNINMAQDVIKRTLKDIRTSREAARDELLKLDKGSGSDG